MEQIFIGIDVSKDRLDVHVFPTNEAFAVSRDGEGLTALIARLGPLQPQLVVLEATGGFEQTVAAALVAARLPLAVINPRQIRDFARATGQLAKTDALGANRYAPSLFMFFSETSRADELKSYAKTNLPPASEKEVAKASDEIEFRAEFKARLTPQLAAWIDTRGARK